MLIIFFVFILNILAVTLLIMPCFNILPYLRTFFVYKREDTCHKISILVHILHTKIESAHGWKKLEGTLAGLGPRERDPGTCQPWSPQHEAISAPGVGLAEPCEHKG